MTDKVNNNIALQKTVVVSTSGVGSSEKAVI